MVMRGGIVSIESLEYKIKEAKYNKLPITGRNNRICWNRLIEVISETTSFINWAEEKSSYKREWMYYVPRMQKHYTKVQKAFANVGIIIPIFNSEASMWSMLRKIAYFDGKIEAIKHIA